jgi:hypothetical protein
MKKKDEKRNCRKKKKKEIENNLDMMMNVLRLIGIMLIGIAIFIHGREKGSISLRLIGIGAILTSFKWSIAE